MGFVHTDEVLDDLLRAGPNWVLNVGGSFDPPHQLHLQIAQVSFKRLVNRLLDICKDPNELSSHCQHLIVVFMPAKQNTLKSAQVVEPKLRFNMMAALLKHANFTEKLQLIFLQLLTKRFPDIEQSTGELIVKKCLRIHIATYETARQQPSYTVDTCCAYREYESVNYLSFALGSDSLLLLPQWHMVNDMLRLIDALIVLPRAEDARRFALQQTEPNRAIQQLTAQMKSNENTSEFDFGLLKSRLQVIVDFEGSALSSTALRAHIGKQELDAIEGSLCPEILQIIQENKLYVQ